MSRISEEDILTTFGKHEADEKEDLAEAILWLRNYEEDKEEVELLEVTQDFNPLCQHEILDQSMYVTMNEHIHEGNSCVNLLVDEALMPYFQITQAQMNEVDDAPITVQIYAGAVKTTVIKRDTDNLSKDEENKHWNLVQAAMLEELRIWVKYRLVVKTEF